MAWVTENKKKKRVTFSDKSENDNHKFVYNTDRWRKTRLNYLKAHPLCEICLDKTPSKIVGATDVHHKTPISSVSGKQQKQHLGYDLKNLCATCQNCHHELHKSKYLSEKDYDKLW